MRFTVTFRETTSQFRASFANLQKITEYKDADPYTGEYTITPRVGEQVMKTAQKVMADDVTIHGIPYFETSNASDGETVYIGSEVEIHGN